MRSFAFTSLTFHSHVCENKQLAGVRLTRGSPCEVSSPLALSPLSLSSLENAGCSLLGGRDLSAAFDPGRDKCDHLSVHVQAR